MNKAFKIIIFLFIGMGIALLCLTAFGVINDNMIHSKGELDWVYIKKLSDISSFLAVPWNIVGVFLLYLTLNIQQDQFRKTDSYIRQQQFETTFFNMLNVLTDIKRSTYLKIEKKDLTIYEISGQEFFDHALKELKNEFRRYYESIIDENPVKVIVNKIKANKPISDTERNIVRDELNLVYHKFYENFHSNLGHYFRYTFNLIKFAINNRGLEKDEKKYIDLIQAQLTNDELSLIFYNAYSDNGLNNSREYKFHEWLDGYNFFENIDSRSLLLREHHVLYARTKFKFLNSDELKLKIAH